MALKQETEFLIPLSSIDHITTPCPTSYHQHSAVILLLINLPQLHPQMETRAVLNLLYLT